MERRLNERVPGMGFVFTQPMAMRLDELISGVRGEPPTDQELLDWLAFDFMNSGWNMKALLFKLVTSATYRQTSDQGGERAADHAAPAVADELDLADADL